MYTITKDGITFTRTKLTDQWRVIMPEQVQDQYNYGSPGKIENLPYT